MAAKRGGVGVDLGFVESATDGRTDRPDDGADDDPADPHAEPDPVALVGLWEVIDAKEEEPGAVLRLDKRSLRLFRACGGIFGN